MKTRLVYIIDIIAGECGGTESQLIKLINGINKDLFETYLICLDTSKWFQANYSMFECSSKVIMINNFKSLSTYFNFIKLVKFMKYFKTDIVHTFFPVANIVGVIAARLAGVRSIISSRRDYGEWMNRNYLFATRLANKYVKKIITNSNYVSELTKQQEAVCDGKIEVIYNGIDLNKFNCIKKNYNLKQQLSIPENDKVVGIVANFRPMKHHHTFIMAAHEILRINNNISFLLVGGPVGSLPIMDTIKALGESLHLKDKLYFVGLQQNIIPYLSIMDVGVNCSEKEGLSNSIMEYMAASIPCAVSSAGGNPDLIVDNINGYTFELDDYRTLAKLILKLLYDEEIRNVFINNSSIKIQKEMSLKAMISNYENLYFNLCASM